MSAIIRRSEAEMRISGCLDCLKASPSSCPRSFYYDNVFVCEIERYWHRCRYSPACHDQKWNGINLAEISAASRHIILSRWPYRVWRKPYSRNEDLADAKAAWRKASMSRSCSSLIWTIKTKKFCYLKWRAHTPINVDEDRFEWNSHVASKANLPPIIGIQ